MLVRSRHPADAPRHYAAIGVVLVISFGMISGLLVVRSPAAAFAVAILVLGIASINVGVEYLVASAVAIAWLGKFGVQVVGLPRFVEFLHFPVIAVALAQSIIRRPREAERLGRRERRMLLFAGAIIASALANTDSVLRTLSALMLTLEPFIVIYLLRRTTVRQSNVVLKTALAMGLMQLPIVAVEFAIGRRADLIQGTLLESGAGAHLLGTGVCLACLMVIAIRPQLTAAAIITAVGVCLAADAKMVVVAFALALFAFFSLTTPNEVGELRAISRHRPRALLASVLATVFVLVALMSYGPTRSAINEAQRTYRHGPKVAIIDAITNDMSAEPGAFVVGFGPGRTVSRLAFLTTPLLLKEGSPVQTLGLEASKRTLRYNALAEKALGYFNTSSFHSPQSSLIGIWGDYGFLGLFAFFGLVVIVMRDLRKLGTRLGNAAFASWVMILPLGFIFDYLEQPPAMLMVAAVSGVALARSGATANSEVIEVSTPSPARTRE